ncbi:MAG: hypothetical protein GX637_07765 [Clostridiales bacterium]|jgi:hypothetical protein|nr:hypothetical protein [Clostridiales bacterium]
MQKKTARLSWFSALMVVALISFMAWLIASQIAASRSGALRNKTTLPARTGQAVEVLGNGIIYSDGTTLHALNDKGLQIWSYAAGSGSKFKVGKGGVAVWSGRALALLTEDQGSTLYNTGSMEDNILDVRLDTTYAAVQVGTEHSSVMLILERGGRQVDRIELPNQTVLDFGFFYGGSLFWVMSMDTEGTVPMCSISTYKPGKMLAGTITDSQQVLYEVLFQSSKIRAVGTTHIKDFDYTSRELTSERILVYGWYLMDLDNDTDNPLMAFVPVDQAETGQIQDVRMIRGQTDQSIHLPYPASRVFARDDSIYAFTSQYVSMCRLGQTSPTTYAMPLYVDDVLGITKNHQAIVSSGGVLYLVPLIR